MTASERPDLSSPVVVHFYRALVGHMDVWRQRMDATTNWAAATTAGMVTFSFSTPESPHFVLLLALGFDVMFLLMEARRYQVFDLWRRRFRTMNRYVVAPGLTGAADLDLGEQARALERVAADLGHLVPQLSLAQAVGYRIRRNYGYVFVLVLTAWVIKLDVHPTAAQSLPELVDRAHIASLLSGTAVLVLTAGAAFAALVLAIRAPSERMQNWAEMPPPLSRWRR